MSLKQSAFGKWGAFTVLVILCTIAAVGYVRYAARRMMIEAPSSPPVSGTGAGPVAAPAPAASPATPPPTAHATLPAKPANAAGRTHLMFRNNILGPNYRKIGVVSLDALDKPRYIDAFLCERVAFASGHGICLTATRGVASTYEAVVFDADFQRLANVALVGPPSRTRLSPDGHVGAVTAFLTGESYMDNGMSTRTILLNTQTGAALGNLEDFTVWRDSQTFKERDFNFWGVTFAKDSNQFYATLSTGGKRYLISGDVKSRQAHVIHEDVECPALSPDNRRIAFKKRMKIGVRIIWKLHTLDLATMKETPLQEERSVDDQVEWLDNKRIMYTLLTPNPKSKVSTDIWVLSADASGPARKFVSEASSPAVF